MCRKKKGKLVSAWHIKCLQDHIGKTILLFGKKTHSVGGLHICMLHQQIFVNKHFCLGCVDHLGRVFRAKVTRTLKFFERTSAEPKQHRCFFYFVMPVLHHTIFIGEYGSDLFTFGTKTYLMFTMRGVKIYSTHINQQRNKNTRLTLTWSYGPASARHGIILLQRWGNAIRLPKHCWDVGEKPYDKW